MKIAEALKAAPETPCPLLDAVITKVSEAKTYTDKTGKPGIRIPVTLSDGTGDIKFTYFNPPKKPEINDVIRITDGVIQAGYVAGSPNEIVLKRFPPPAGTIQTLGKGSLPQAPQVQQPAPVPAASPFLTNQPIPDAATFFNTPQPQAPAPVASSAFQPTVQYTPQVVAPAPVPSQQDPSSPDQAQAILALGEYMAQMSEALTTGMTQICNTLTQAFTNYQNTLVNASGQLSAGLQAIWEELNHEGVDIESKFDQVYARMIKIGKRPQEIFDALSKKSADIGNLGDHKTAIIAVATDWNIDLSDLI